MIRFYYDAAEALPDEPLSIEEVAPRGCRYDSQIAVFGVHMQERLANLSMFLVKYLLCNFLMIIVIIIF